MVKTSKLQSNRLPQKEASVFMTLDAQVIGISIFWIPKVQKYYGPARPPRSPPTAILIKYINDYFKFETSCDCMSIKVIPHNEF